jgi:hypothetical protein
MSIINPELSPNLLENTVVKHLDDPYSVAALAEPQKEFIDLGAIDVAHLPDAPEVSRFIADRAIKLPGKDFDYAASDVRYRDQHLRVVLAAHAILGKEPLKSSSIYFTHRSGPLHPGETLSTNADMPHLDGEYRGSLCGESLTRIRLLGVMASGVPTAVYQGPITHEDLIQHGDEIDIDEAAIQRLTREDLPLDRLLLTGSGLPHNEQPAQVFTPVRHFMRWTIWI